MRPLVGSTSRLIMRSVVVLPQPDGPTSTHTSPSGTNRLSSWTATRPFGNCLVTASSRITTAARVGERPGYRNARSGYGDRGGARGVRRGNARRLVVGERPHDRDLAARAGAPPARRLVVVLGPRPRAPARGARAPPPRSARPRTERDGDPVHDPVARR